MQVISTEIAEVKEIRPVRHRDPRGFFSEIFREDVLRRHGIDVAFVQENHSHSAQGTLRGLHYQKMPKAQGKLVRVVVGEIFDVTVDIRKGSPRYGRWIGISLSVQNNKMLYIPPGFAHGACVLSEEAGLLYMVTAEYAPSSEAGVIWNDPALAIDWPVKEPILSSRDQTWPTLAHADNNFIYEESKN